MRDTVFLGIDLGTSRTSVVTSTGARATVWSYVGYPRDHVAARRLGGRDVIYGQEALEHRLSLNLLRPLAGGAIKVRGATDSPETTRAIRDLIGHAVSLAKVPAGSRTCAVIGAPAEASVRGKAAIIECTAGCLDAVIVTSEPFAVAYGLDFLDDTLVIDIGAGTTDLCRVHGRMPEAADQRTHEVAGDAIDERFAALIAARFPEAQFTINMVRAIKEKYASVSANMDPVLVDMPVAGRPRRFDLTALLHEACTSVIAPTVSALQDLIATYDPEFQARMRGHILLGGGGSQIRGLGLAIERAMQDFGGAAVTTVEEPRYAGANGALQIARDMPDAYWAEFQRAG